MKILPYIYVCFFYVPTAFAQAEKPPPIVEEPPQETIHCRIFVSDPRPEFPGGEKALMAYLGDNLNLPQNCFSVTKEGNENTSGGAVKAFIGFTVEKDGCIENVKILRGSDYPLFDKAAANVVSAMPQWSPALQNGKAVKVSYTLPIKIRID